ncbi:MAG: lipoprotein-releasing system permease protein [Clostridiales bacterium]|nr:lipoprotein-releasing system permease protein [Clostridiales bacterium]
MRLGFRIATKFLKSSIGQTFLIILGIAIGVSVQIFIGSLIQGLQKSLVDKTIGNSAQITISKEDEEASIDNYPALIDSIKQNQEAVTNITASSNHPALLSYKEQSKSLLVRGFPLEQAEGIYRFSTSLTSGRMPSQDGEILLGVDLSEEFGIQVGDVITFITPDQTTKDATVTGFFDLKVASINSGWAVTNLETMSSIFPDVSGVSSIELQLKESSIFKADQIAADLLSSLSDRSLTATNWMEQNESLLSGLNGQSISSYMIQVFVMISVILGIASVLAITVIQKSKQIGILKAMGIRNATTRYIFLFEGLILGFFGALLGILFGLGLSFAFTKFALNPDGTPVVALFLDARFILLSGFIAVLASVLAALMPAIRSSKLDPIDIIRNN